MLDPDLHPYGQDAAADAALLLDVRLAKWALEWAEKDVCLHIMECGEEWAREVSRHADDRGNLGKIRCGAALARYWSRDRRSPVDSPRQHAKWMRQDKEKSA